MKINVIDPTVDNRWDNFVAGQPNSTIFHTTAWARTIIEAYSYSPRYYVLEDDAVYFKHSEDIVRIIQTNNSEKERYRQNNTQKIGCLYSWEKIAREYLKLFGDLV